MALQLKTVKKKYWRRTETALQPEVPGGQENVFSVHLVYTSVAPWVKDAVSEESFLLLCCSKFSSKLTFFQGKVCTIKLSNLVWHFSKNYEEPEI